MHIADEVKEDIRRTLAAITWATENDRWTSAIIACERLSQEVERMATMRGPVFPPLPCLVLWAFEKVWPREVDLVSSAVYESHMELIDEIGYARWCDALSRWPVDNGIPMHRNDIDPMVRLSHDGQMELYKR